MSKEFPIIAVTGSSGDGSTMLIKAFQHIFWRERVKAAFIQGNAFHRFTRKEMQLEMDEAKAEGKHLSHFSPAGNELEKLDSLFFQYSGVGTGKYRHYLHTKEAAALFDQQPGTFTAWENMDPDTDILLYRGLHGAAIDGDIDIAQYPDLLIGVVPSVNLEWKRKMQRDTASRDKTREEVQSSILDRMHDYVHHITPQFSRTHINFQLIPQVDTSDPFDENPEISIDEMALVIHFQDFEIPNLAHLLDLLKGSQMTRQDTLLVPGAEMGLALEIIIMPAIRKLITESRSIRGITDVPKSRGAGVLDILEQE
ncbi:MAG: phosphoribulokinase [Proteobacteria bacterium]|nr:phosphoribulokinase [Pseudomonadota bacterium]